MTTREEHIQRLSKAGDWRSALKILASDRFLNDPRVWFYVSLEGESIDFAEILADGTFSGGEKRLLRLAASLFTPGFEINLYSTLSGLDEDATLLALRAMCSYCDVLPRDL